tara:strand:- start:20 stop:319 length:300 start_codon:yes stop_codon:yes gene_type:complete
MSQETNNPSTEEKEYTEQELANMRKSMIANYKSEISFLKVQAEYEKLNADIEEHKTRRYIAMAQAAQIFAAHEQEEESPAKQPPAPRPKKRTLKTEVNV